MEQRNDANAIDTQISENPSAAHEVCIDHLFPPFDIA